jgi:hypothetical protein
MKKLKDILLEGYAWERKADGSLPTLKDAIATHRTNLSESEKSLSDLEYAVKQHERDNHVYDKTKLTNIYNQLSDIDQKTAKTKFSKYFGSDDAVKAKIAKEPRWQDSDGDGNWYEPGEDVKEGVEDEMSADVDMDALNMPNIDDNEETDINESFWKRVNGNLHGHEHILRESFRK